MSKLNGVTFKKKVLSTEYSKVSEQVFRTRFEAKKKAIEDISKELDPRTPAEKLADQVTPLYK
jgi:tRNA (uracil-5-)-methyltransferase